jgi:hypothetical protein
MSKNAMDMNFLVGKSYTYLKRLFGDRVNIPGDFILAEQSEKSLSDEDKDKDEGDEGFVSIKSKAEQVGSSQISANGKVLADVEQYEMTPTFVTQSVAGMVPPIGVEKTKETTPSVVPPAPSVVPPAPTAVPPAPSVVPPAPSALPPAPIVVPPAPTVVPPTVVPPETPPVVPADDITPNPSDKPNLIETNISPTIPKKLQVPAKPTGISIDELKNFQLNGKLRETGLPKTGGE